MLIGTDSAAGSIGYYRFHGRLAMFRGMPEHKDYWEGRWAAVRLRELLNTYASGRLDEFEKVFTGYLPKDLPVLEAGCGPGKLVRALSARAYQVEGVDYEDKVIERIRAEAPDLNVRIGDVYHLDVPGGTYGGYISIGLFEHNHNGPLEGLREARRVLHPRGVAFISVPYLNQPRTGRLRGAPEASGTRLDNGMDFYQFYFTREEFESYINRAGLEVADLLPYSVHAGLTRDYALGRWLEARRFFSHRLRRRVIRWAAEASAGIRWRWAHMLMFVCKPK